MGVIISTTEKALYPPLVFFVGEYHISNIKANKQEKEALESFHFSGEIFRRHDHLNIVVSHYLAMRYTSTYKHETYSEETIYIRGRSFGEVLSRLNKVQKDKKCREEKWKNKVYRESKDKKVGQDHIRKE